MATLTLPNGTKLTRISRADVLARVKAIPLGVIPYNQGVISTVTKKRSDCTGLVSYAWATPDSGPGMYLKAYNTASFVTERVVIPIDFADLQPGDCIGYMSASSPGNGGHATIWLGGDKHGGGRYHVWDHGSGMGPKDRWVQWDGKSTGFLHPDHLRPWRYVGLVEADGTTYQPGESLADEEEFMDTKLWQSLLIEAGYNLGTSGADGVFGPMTRAASVAALKAVAAPAPASVDPAALKAAVAAQLAGLEAKATTSVTLSVKA